MYRYFLELAYDGTNYHGWQIQPNSPTVQQTLNESLEKILRQKVYVVGCGRTDTGVHATFFVAHFDIETELQDLNQLTFKLNCVLPQDIAVYKFYPVDGDLHARFSAKSRTYEYHFSKTKNPLLRNFSYKPLFPLDFQKMDCVAQTLKNYTDFTSFARIHSDTKTNDCITMDVHFTETPDEWIFTIKANRFLRNMVRAIVGTLMDVGRGRLTQEDFEKIIESKDRKYASSSADARGLMLVNVEY